MPRKPRIEFEGAVYHVLNRGNYQEAIFKVSGAGQMFEQTLFETCTRFGWRLHAYVCLSNHFHMAVETPEANLVQGMQWLSSAFGNRFNRLVHKQGHIFQGRYKSLIVEDDGYLLQLVNYIHLNPVRAGIVELERLREYSLSSFPKFFSKKRPACLCCSSWLYLAGHLKPTASGMRCYHQYLGLQVEQDPAKQKELHRNLCRGWHIGTSSGQKALLRDIVEGTLISNKLDITRFGEEGAQVLLNRGLTCLGQTEDDLEIERKSVPWKIVLASWIKSQCGISNAWLSQYLHMGHPNNISRLIAQETRERTNKKLWKKLQSARKET